MHTSHTDAAPSPCRQCTVPSNTTATEHQPRRTTQSSSNRSRFRHSTTTSRRDVLVWRPTEPTLPRWPQIMALPPTHPVPGQSCHIPRDSTRFHHTGHHSPWRCHCPLLMSLSKAHRHTSDRTPTARTTPRYWLITAQSPSPCRSPPGSRRPRGCTPCSPHSLPDFPPTRTDGQFGSRRPQRGPSKHHLLPGSPQIPAWPSRISSHRKIPREAQPKTILFFYHSA